MEFCKTISQLLAIVFFLGGVHVTLPARIMEVDVLVPGKTIFLYKQGGPSISMFVPGSVTSKTATVAGFLHLRSYLFEAWLKWISIRTRGFFHVDSGPWF